jgi:hypothetical protein
MSTFYKLIIICSLLAFLGDCRYKDNDDINLKSVKKRLGRTWLLKEALLTDSNNLDLIAQKPWLNRDSLYISNGGGNKINFRTRHLRGFFLCELIDRKTKIQMPPNFSNEYKITITRLTSKELWMEGNAILRLCDRPFATQIKIKYEAAN